MKTNWNVLYLAIALAFAQTASADLLIDYGNAAKPAATVSTTNLSETGTRPALPIFSGWAKDVPLDIALQQVMPEGFTLAANGLDTGASTSWSAIDGNWVSTLSALAVKSGLLINIDWNNKKLSLAPASNATAILSPKAIKVDPVKAETVKADPVKAETVKADPVKADPVKAEPVKAEPAVQAAEVVKPAPAPAVRAELVVAPPKPIATPYVAPVRTPVVPTGNSSWQLDPNYTLRYNIEKWVKQAGWNRLVWEAVDYPIVAPAQFHGDFASPEGPLATLIAAYENSEQPLIAKLSTMDRVVFVRNKYYERERVVPTSPKEMAPDLFSPPADEEKK